MLPTRPDSIRLPEYDYSSPGAYFVTTCTHGRLCVFGTIRQAHRSLSPLGHLAADHLRDLPRHYANLTLDAWVVMPNHVHAVIRGSSRTLGQMRRW